ncbi:MAG TPA: alpha/beta family hydrolase [Pyrinomonadaceae bacterium]|nr:alpha/beta family hydrolase [Pyrinomonadaceae bacterium]
MYPSGNLLIPAEHGQLEAILKEPRSRQSRGVALVLHPHPLGGGTMHNKVVFRAAAALNDGGVTTLRINFRGVGQSTGQHDEGRGEREDVRAGLDYLSTNYPNLSITLCGFSFGARVGLEVGIEDARVRYLIGIGTPLNKYDFEFLQACRKPLLLIHGERDEFGDVQHVREIAARLEKQTQVRLVVIPGADHFFEDRLDELKRAITDWITEQLAATDKHGL